MQRIPGIAPRSPVQQLMDSPLPEQGFASAAASTGRKMTVERIQKAMSLLIQYKNGKQTLERRIVENDRWYRQHHWENIEKKPAADPQKSAWLFNSILNKHADAMDNIPIPNVQPRAEDDKATAELLSEVLPVILDQNEFENAWSEAWFDKLRSGAAVYGIFWNQRKLNGLGDIDIRPVDLLNLFWEPGIKDIQQSRNLFHVEKQPNDALKARYKQLENETLGSGGFTLAEYDKDDNDSQDVNKSLVIDWYYKVWENGREVLHFCKFVGNTVLYSSEDDPNITGGFYSHGKYPFVFDVLFPIKGSPAGFGYIDIMKDTQERIDQLGSSIVKNARMRATKRFFVKPGSGVKEEEFADWNRELVHTEGGGVGEDAIREIKIDPIGGDVMSVYQALINELKETSGNRDFSQGGTTAGVTAASAIAALQEAGSKLSRDMLLGSYSAFTSVCNMVLELIRQFYDLPRQFRIVGQDGAERFEQFDNTGLIMRTGDDGTAKLPIFDIKIRPQKRNPYSKVAQNEMMLQFYQQGFFNPMRADESLLCIDGMDFDGKNEIMAKIRSNAILPKLLAFVGRYLPIVAKLDPMLAQMVLPQLQQGGFLPRPMVGDVSLPRTNNLGEAQTADGILERKRQEVRNLSDPFGGQA